MRTEDDRGVQEVLLRALRAEDLGNAARAANGLMEMAKRGRLSQATFMEIMRIPGDASPIERALAAEAMWLAAKRGVLSANAQADLMLLLHDPVLEVRYQSSRTLRLMARAHLVDEEAVMPLIAAVDDPCVEVAVNAAEALPALFFRHGPYAEAAPTLCRGLTLADQRMVQACLKGLDRMAILGMRSELPEKRLRALAESDGHAATIARRLMGSSTDEGQLP
jgi:hypothetical protein